MLDTLTGFLLVAGFIAFLWSNMEKSIEFKELKIPPFNKASRIIIGRLGIFFMILSLLIYLFWLVGPFFPELNDYFTKNPTFPI